MSTFYPRRPRRGSVFVAGWQRQRLGHADRLRIMEAARRLERATWRRGDGLHGGYLRETGLRVLWTLLYRGFGRGGACDPALAQIADEARLARSTVQLALERLERAGILQRVQRGAVMGRRWVQATNAYLFRPPAAWVSDTEARQALDSDLLEKKELATAQLVLPPASPLDKHAQAELLQRWGLTEWLDLPSACGQVS
jgi:hypothetical protein